MKKILSVLLLSLSGYSLAHEVPSVNKEQELNWKCVGSDGSESSFGSMEEAIYQCQLKKQNTPEVNYELIGTYLIGDIYVPTPVNCAGTWSEPTRVPGSETQCINNSRNYTTSKTFTISTPPQNGGVACPVSPQLEVLTEPCVSLPPVETPVLSVAPNGKNFRLNNQPWFWLGDTAWKLYAISKEDVTFYLEDRKNKGIKLIQGPMLLTQQTVASMYEPGSPLKLKESGWEIIDHAVKEAGRLGLIISLTIMWGSDSDYLFPDVAQHAEITSLIVKRYATQAHVFWIGAGEYHKIAYTPAGIVDGIMKWNVVRRDLTVEEKARYEAVLNAINTNKHPKSLISMHPDGWKSVAYDWKDNANVKFYLLQPSDSSLQTSRGVMQEKVYTPIKPIVNAEAGYEGQEDIPEHELWAQRKYVWYTAFTNAAGYTYGHGKVWDFNDGWKTFLTTDATNLVFNIFRNFMNTIHKESNTSAQARIVDPGTYGDSFVAALRDTLNNKVLYAYVGNGRSFSVKTNTLDAGTIKAKWFNPRTGTFMAEFNVIRADSVLFDPPGAVGANNDWVLQLNVI